jgi:hypothetical protein
LAVDLACKEHSRSREEKWFFFVFKAPNVAMSFWRQKDSNLVGPKILIYLCFKKTVIFKC